MVLRTMPPPGLQIYLHPRVTLSFDLLTPKVDRFMLLLCKPVVPVCIKISSFIFENIMFASLVTDEQMNGREHNACSSHSGLVEAQQLCQLSVNLIEAFLHVS